jgi:hypothetical protein
VQLDSGVRADTERYVVRRRDNTGLDLSSALHRLHHER